MQHQLARDRVNNDLNEFNRNARRTRRVSEMALARDSRYWKSVIEQKMLGAGDAGSNSHRFACTHSNHSKYSFS